MMENRIRIRKRECVGIGIGILLVLALSTAFALPKMKLEWVYNVTDVSERGFTWSCPLLADLNGDGTQEVIVGTEKGGRMVCVKDPGQLMWVYPPLDEDQSGRLNKAHTAGDIDGDGAVEVLYSAGDVAGTVYCLNGADGTLKWSWTDPEANFKYGGTIIRDIDGDGVLDIVTVGADAKVYVLSNTGELRWSKFLPPGRSIDSMPQAFDIDKDGEVEVIVFSRSQGEGPGGVDAFTGRLYCLSPTGTEKWSWGSSWADVLHEMPTVADVNNDGEYEIVMGLWKLDSTDAGGVVVINYFGQEIARKHTDKQVAHDAMVWDLDGDGKKEILIGARDSIYYCLNPDLSEKWTFNYTGIIGPVSKPINMGGAIGDVTGDGQYNIIFQTWQNSTVIVLDINGHLAAEPYNLGGEATNAAVIGDIDNDGKSEIVVCAGPAMYALTLDAQYDETTFVWPMMGRDPVHSGVVPIPEILIAAIPLLAIPFVRRR